MVSEAVPLPKPVKLEPNTPRSVSGAKLRDTLEDPDNVLANVAQCIEQLRGAAFSPQDKEQASKRLLGLLESRENAKKAIASHTQAIPLLVNFLRTGTTASKINVATIMAVLCKEEDLRMKVLLGGCIPPLLALLKIGSTQAHSAAAKAIYAVTQAGGTIDHVGAKIFSTEGVVPSLWEQFQPGNKWDLPVLGLLTGALRNLCNNNVDGYWPATLEAGGIDVLVALLQSGSPDAQANACAILNSLITAVESSGPQVFAAGGTGHIFKLLSQGNETSVRAEAAGALRALTLKSSQARESIGNPEGVKALISAVVAPSKEFMQGIFAQALQENAMGALANVMGGLSVVVSSLAKNVGPEKAESYLSDIIGALAYALMIIDGDSYLSDQVSPVVIEKLLVKLFEHKSDLVHERVLEALASLYGNNVLAADLELAEAKKMLVGLITMADPGIQAELIKSLVSVSSGKVGLWEAIKGRQGVQFIISLLGVSSEQQQEHAASLLSILSEKIDESNWAITSCGGIPPLLQLLETGSVKAKEESAFVLGNLCSHSEDIRACVEKAEAEPAFLWLLKNAGPEGQAIAARALIKLVKVPDADTMSQLSAMAVGELPESKEHVLEVMRGLLSVVPINDISDEGAASHEALATLISLLETSQTETQEKAASVLADLIDLRKDWHDAALVMKAVEPLNKLLHDGATEGILAQAARALGALFYSIEEHELIKNAARDAMPFLIKLSDSANLPPAEAALKALANLLLDKEVALDVPTGDILVPITRVLQEGTDEGKNDAARVLTRLIVVHSLDNDMVEIVQGLGTVRALADILSTVNFEETKTSYPLEALSAMARAKCDSGHLLGVISDTPDSLRPFVTCVAIGVPALSDKAVEVMSRLGQDRLLGDLIAETPGCIMALANRIIESQKMEVKAGGAQLLICASEEHRETVLEILDSSDRYVVLIKALVGMLSAPVGGEGDDIETDDFTAAHGTHVALWLLSIIATHDSKSKLAIMQADAIDVLAEKLTMFAPNAATEESGSTSACALLMAILFQDRDVSRSSATNLRAIPALTTLLKSKHTFDRFFSAQALANLVCHGSRGTLLAVANSGAVSGLISMLGSAETESSNVADIADKFSLLRNPDQVALEKLFKVDDIKFGATARKAIPALVDLLKPIAGRPGAAPLALSLLTQISESEASHVNRVTMAEAGAIDALTKYLSLGPQDAFEEAAAELLRIIFTSPDLRRHDSALGAVDGLIAVLRLGARGSRYTAARALAGLLGSDNIRNADVATQAVPPLTEMLGSAVEREQCAAIEALISLAVNNPGKAVMVGAEYNTLEILSDILCGENNAIQVKELAAELCAVLFASARVRSKAAATVCISPLIGMLIIEEESLQHVATRALDNLLEDAQQAEEVAKRGAVVPLVNLVATPKHSALDVAVSALLKLGRDRPLCKLDMKKAGVIEYLLEPLQTAPEPFCSLATELLKILTNNASISVSASASKAVEPLFSMLARPDILPTSQEFAMQTLVNVIEKPQCVAMQGLTSSQALYPLVQLLESETHAVVVVAAELLSYLLVEDRFQKDPLTQGSIPPLVKLAGTKDLIDQGKAVKALELASQTWPEVVADAGGVYDISKIILQVEPPAPHTLWESAAKVLSNILNYSSHQEFPLSVIVKLLRSSSEQTIGTALHTLLLIEKEDALTAEAMADAGAIELLVEILRCHQCEESAARLLEALVNNVKVRELKVTKLAICPLSEFLLDAQTQSEQARLLAALALGDLFQNEHLAKSSDAVSACRAFVSLLEGQHSEELQMVAICALQNLVAGSRPNRRSVAEAGGIPVLQDLVASGNPDMTVQAATLIRILFQTYTIQDFVSIEVFQALLASLENDLYAARIPPKEDILRSINTLFNLYPKFRTSEVASASIPLLVTALKAADVEAAQEAALDTLFVISETWSEIPAEDSRAQAGTMADAIPTLQMLMRSGPQRFHERIELLLQCLPGNLLVTIKRGTNLKQSMGSTNAFCKITLGNGPPRLTRVVSNSVSPQWEQGFAWAFEVPPKGQKLHISCKNKGAFSKGSLGKVSIQIDRVVMLGQLSGEYHLKPVAKDGSPRTLEVEFLWANRG